MCSSDLKDFKAYQKGKSYRPHQREIMKELKLPPGPDSSAELDETIWKSQNTYWLGDDASSLGQFWPANRNEASSSQIPPNDEEADDDAEDEQYEEDEDDEGFLG